MDMYSQKSPSYAQKALLVFLELCLIALSWYLMFGGGLLGLGLTGAATELQLRTVFIFNCVVFLRMIFTLFLFVKRRIPFEEAISVPFAFALYYIGFSVLAYLSSGQSTILYFTGILLFLVGSNFNSLSEWQRYLFKKDPSNAGHLYMGGLFRYSMHINYFGDLLWVAGYACVTANPYSVLIVIFLFSFFWFFNIPKLDEHLASRYGQAFHNYARHTKRFIPFVL